MDVCKSLPLEDPWVFSMQNNKSSKSKLKPHYFGPELAIISSQLRTVTLITTGCCIVIKLRVLACLAEQGHHPAAVPNSSLQKLNSYCPWHSKCLASSTAITPRHEESSLYRKRYPEETGNTWSGGFSACSPLFLWWQRSILVLQCDPSQINPNIALLGTNACSLLQSPKRSFPFEGTAASKDFFKPFQARQHRSQLPISYQHDKTKMRLIRKFGIL